MIEKARTEKKVITRRKFVRDISSIGLGVALAPTLLNFHVERAHAVDNVGKVVVATSEDLTSGVSVNKDVAKRLLSAAIKRLTDKSTAEEAWKSIFPSLTEDDVIGIKVNTINYSLSSHPEVVYAIADSLIEFAGVAENNIIIWDRTTNELRNNGRYQINKGETGVRCFGTDGAYDNTNYKIGGQSRRLSRILTQTCTHLINVPLLKDHGTAGTTLSMKNHYGSVDNPGALHGNNCDPYIAELNNTAPIKEKTRLIVLDAAVGIYQGGPMGSPQFNYNSLILGQDPVALDYHCSQIIDEERQKRGLKPVANVGRPAKYIQTAAKLGLGTNDPNEMQVIQVEAQDVDAKGKSPATWGKLKGAGVRVSR